MLNLDVIEKEILTLEKKDTTYAVIERLAWLYTVRDHMMSETHEDPSVIHEEGDSEFMQAIHGRTHKDIYNVMDELMSTIQVIQPSVYSAVMRKILE